MSDPLHALRRVHLALQFSLTLDLDAVEREIERQSALSGGNSADAAMARFALAFAQESPKAVADYIDRHRVQLFKHIEKKYLNAIEIEMLARAGSIQKAEECFMSLINDGLSEAEQIPLRRVIEKSTGTDPLYVCEAQYESSGALTDLIILVDLL